MWHFNSNNSDIEMQFSYVRATNNACIEKSKNKKQFVVFIKKI